MDTPHYSLPRLRIKKFKSQPAWRWPLCCPCPASGTHRRGVSVVPPSQAASFVTRITHSCFTSRACPCASPSPSTSTSHVGITTLGGSPEKHPQLLLRGDAKKQWQSLPRPREKPGEMKTPCHSQANVVFHFLRLHSWELHKPSRHRGGPCKTSRSHATSRTRGAPHLREVPHLHPQGCTPGRTSSTTSRAPASLSPHHHGVSASCCLPSHNLPARKAVPSPGHHWSPHCWFSLQRPQHPGPWPTQGHPSTSSHQPEGTPGAQKQVLHTPQSPAKHIPCSYGRQSLRRGTVLQDWTWGLG